MKVKSIRKGRTVKTVTVANVTGHTDSEVVDFACAAAGETRSSLFGWNVAHWDDESVVSLHTD